MTFFRGRHRAPGPVPAATPAERIELHALAAMSLVDKTLSAGRQDPQFYQDALLDIRLRLMRGLPT